MCHPGINRTGYTVEITVPVHTWLDRSFVVVRFGLFWQAEHKFFAANSDGEGKPSLARAISHKARTDCIVSIQSFGTTRKMVQALPTMQQALLRMHRRPLLLSCMINWNILGFLN